MLSAIGFASGLHYARAVGVEQIINIKGCFEFGLWALLSGSSFGSCFGRLALSCLKNFGMLFLGCLSWGTFLLVPVSLFGISFKMGVCFSFASGILRWQGILEILFLMVLSLLVMAAAVLFSTVILNRCLYHSRVKHIDMTDKNFFLGSLAALGIFFVCIAVLLALCCFTNNHLYGFFNTFL